MLQVTILCDNIVGSVHGIGEHGFAALIERDEGSYLFDTGQGKGLIPNAASFSKDLKSIKKIFLSHGHYDHTGGLHQVLPLLPETEVLGHPDIFTERFSKSKEDEKNTLRYVGIRHNQAYLETLGAKFLLERGFLEAAESIFLTGQVPRVTAFEKNASNLLIREKGAFAQDPILDDQSLVIDTAKGLVVVFGCAHAGMINTLRYIREKTGKDRIHAVLGGTHLMFLSNEQLEASVWEFKEMKPQLVAVSHCTGLGAACRLMREFGGRFTFAHVGRVFHFE